MSPDNACRLVTIYALVDPRDKLVRYVGASFYRKERYLEHINGSDSGWCPNTKNLWMGLLRSKRLLPGYRILELCNPEVRREREQYWISRYADTVYNGTICNPHKVPVTPFFFCLMKELLKKKIVYSSVQITPLGYSLLDQ